jgi:hypothetical protein
MERKLTNSSPFMESTSKHSIYPLNFLYSQLLASVIRTTTQRQTNLHPVLVSLPHARTLHVAAERN